jgi:hypothetical protein
MKAFVKTRIICLLVLLALGASVATADTITVVPNSFEFGTVPIGYEARLPFRITNVGYDDEINGLVLPSDGEHFKVLIPEAFEAKTTIYKIVVAIMEYESDFGRLPRSFEVLLENTHLVIEQELMRQWSFIFIGGNPIVQIEAVSTSFMPGGPGHVIILDIQTGEFVGYGDEDDLYYFLLDFERSHTLYLAFTPSDEDELQETLTFFIYHRYDEPLDTLYIQIHGSGSSCDVGIVEPERLPSKLYLQPSYPNPFNSSTTIKYGLPCPGNVTLRIFNPLGQQVSTLFEGYQSPGFHTTTMNAGDLPSGLYLVRLETVGRKLSGKVILAK